MNTPFLHRFRYAVSHFGGRAGARTLVRAASLLAITSALCATTRPAAANHRPRRLEFTHLRCISASLEGDPPGTNPGDEPYVVMFAARLWPTFSTKTVRTSVFADVDTGEPAPETVPLWPIAGLSEPIVRPQQVVFLVALIESDGSVAKAEQIRSQIQTEVTAKLISGLPGYNPADPSSRAALVNGLRAKMKAVIDLYKFYGTPDGAEDDVIGDVEELPVTVSDLNATALDTPGAVAFKMLPPFTDGDAEYNLYFRLRTY